MASVSEVPSCRAGGRTGAWIQAKEVVMLGGFAVRGLVLAALASSHSAVQAQEAVVIPDQVSCPACTIEFEEVAVLGGMDVSGRPLDVIEDAEGRYWAAFVGDLPVVFDPAGEFVGRVGRTGQGPGEFIRAAAFFRSGDSVVVLDAGQPRASVVAPDLTVARTVRLPGFLSGGRAVRWPSEVVMTGVVATSQHLG